MSVRVLDNLKILEPLFQVVGGEPQGEPDRPQRGEVIQRGTTNAKSRLWVHPGILRHSGFFGNRKKQRNCTHLDGQDLHFRRLMALSTPLK